MPLTDGQAEQAYGTILAAGGTAALLRQSARVNGLNIVVADSGFAALNKRLDEIVDAAFPTGSIGSGKVWSVKERLKAAELPTTGKIRFVPRKSYEASNPLARGPNNGFIDRFGNEWVRGPSRTQGQAFEWDIQLSKTGREKIGWLTRDGSHTNVSLDGKITHR